MVRFPKGPKAKHPDEKVEAEVLTLKLIRDKTNIPVPGVKAWGLATENKFGLGPFIMMSVIKGVESILRTPDSKARLMREDIGDGVASKIYRQVARFMLQLFKLDFPRIGSLSKSTASRRAVDFAAEIDSRPFTWRAHEALVLGGVDTYCMFHDLDAVSSHLLISGVCTHYRPKSHNVLVYGRLFRLCSRRGPTTALSTTKRSRRRGRCTTEAYLLGSLQVSYPTSRSS